MRLSFHRKEQWDLQCWPIVCVHVRTANACTRLFCVWRWGVAFTSWRSLKRLVFA